MKLRVSVQISMMFSPAFKKSILLAVLFCFYSSTALASSPKEIPWTLKKNREGIRVYTYKLVESPILEFRADRIYPARACEYLHGHHSFQDIQKIPRVA